MTKNALRQRIKKLTDAGKLKRYDTGIYFIPRPSKLKSGSTLSPIQIINKKYLSDQENKVCGYWSGYGFVNMMRLTTQCPVIYEIVSNNTTTEYRELKIKNTSVILRRPNMKITEENFRVLQFLDLINDAAVYAELKGKELKKNIQEIMQEMEITLEVLEPYLKYYPDKTYKNMYNMGVFTNVPA